MPEGDTIHAVARRMRPVLQGQVPEEVATPQPRHRMEDWPRRHTTFWCPGCQR